jgi:hypothetical protein
MAGETVITIIGHVDRTSWPDKGPLCRGVGRADVISGFALLAMSDHDLRGRCPFCGSTAFRVRPGFGTFHCFGCGEDGDAPAFTAKIDARES